MQIFKWSGPEQGAEYIGLTEEDDQQLLWYDDHFGDALPDLALWRPPTLTQYLGENGKRKSRPVLDAVSSADHNLISERAAASLSDIWDRHATLYPVNLDDWTGAPYYMVVVNTALDCLDRDKSDGPRQMVGPTPELFAYLNKWVFDGDCVGDVDLFVTPDSPTICYVSEQFKSRVIEEDLKGFGLRRDWWDTDEWIS